VSDKKLESGPVANAPTQRSVVTRAKRASTDPETISSPGVPKRVVGEAGVQSDPLYLSRRSRTAPSPRVVLPRAWRIAEIAAWVVIALPALYQLVLLATAIAGRIGYPYDLEWMEGGMLHHALRIKSGEGIYVPPSVDFIPYLYTPLYPSLLALFGGAFGINYVLGRVISVLSLVGIFVVGAANIANKRYEHEHGARAAVWTGILLGCGVFAASYPYMEGWFDLVRADTLFLLMVTAGIAGLPKWAAESQLIAGDWLRAHARVAAGAALLALSFFCKQTGIIYVALGGMIVLVVAWRRLPAYIATAGVIGLGGTLLLQKTTNGWFWIYVSKIHRAHDFNMDRFWKSFGNILLKFPLMSVVIVIGLVTVLRTWWVLRRVPMPARPFLLWTAAFVVSTVVGAVGWGTEFAHFNAYMPAFLHGAFAAGAAVPAMYGCWRAVLARNKQLDAAGLRRAHATASGASLALAALLAITCWQARWKPAQFVPTARDVAAGDKLIKRLRAIDGDIWMPSHPWYAHLAGKQHTYVHRMGVKDVTTRQARVVEGLDEAVRAHAFAALVLDDRDVHLELPVLHSNYRPALTLPPDERPRLFTGAKVVPDAIWVPALKAAPPAGAKSLFDFEQLTWDGWRKSGNAWGVGPVQTSVPGEPIVIGATGQRFATSAHDGDASTGRVTTPPFLLDGSKLTLSLGGGTDATKLRVELWVEKTIIATASVPEPGGETLHEVTLAIPAEQHGKEATLVFVDDATTGHLTIDDVWLWN
jgi:hypothetical protein